MAASLTDPRVQRYVVVGVLIVLVTAIWYFRMYSPKLEEIKRKENQLEDLRLKIHEAKLKVETYEELKREVMASYYKYRALESLLPLTRSVPDFLNHFYVAAKNNMVYLSSLTPEPTKQVDFYFVSPYSLKISTTYHGLGGFLADVANFPFIVNAGGMNITAIPSATEDLSINVDLTLYTYNITESQRMLPPHLEELPE
ncbi:type 4a pilus biogenesis protein PilO [bacterium]|nr:type 4a pilus biogenesis protein PilO [bacterium]